MSLIPIINTIATRLSAVAGLSAARVSVDRFTGNPVEDVPAVAIYHQATDRSPITMGNPIRYRHVSQIAIELQVAADTGLQAALEVLTLQIIAAVESDRSLGGNAFDCYCTGFSDELSSDSDRLRGARTIIFTVEWDGVITF